ncbi:unnamed protein product, partial [Timema podura]|nr:unnamed protein product [Timema podura]
MFGVDTAVSVAQCLHTVTEDNPAAISQLVTSDIDLEKMMRMEGEDPAVLLLRTLAAGLALNVKYGRAADLPSSALLQLMSVLAQTLNVDHRAALNRLTSELPLEESSKEASQVEQALVRAEHLLDAQRTALEILANLCSGEGNLPRSQRSKCCDWFSNF